MKYLKYISNKGFENLKIWRRSFELACRVFGYFKETNDFAFKNQILKSSLSVPSNIAEGYERNSKKEFGRFLDISQGSNAELRTQLLFALENDMIDEEIAVNEINESRSLSKMINGFKKSLNLEPKNQ